MVTGGGGRKVTVVLSGQKWVKEFFYSENKGEPLEKFWPQGSERPDPPTHTYGHTGGW